MERTNMSDPVVACVVDPVSKFLDKEQMAARQGQQSSAESEISAEEKAVVTRQNKSSGNIVSLNVGGKIFATKRDTLRQISGSLLERMFGEEWEEDIDTDCDGNVFFDLDPDLFSIVLHFLAASRIHRHKKELVTLRPVPRHLEGEFRLLLEYLGLESIIQPDFNFKWSRNFKSMSVLLLKEHTTAVSEGTTNLRHHVFSDDIYHSHVFEFSVYIEALEDWFMIGFIDADVRMGSNVDPFVHPTAFGWGSDGEVYVHGVESSKKGYPGRKMKADDRFSIIFDGRNSTMSLVAPVTKNESIEYKIPKIDSNKNWRLVLTTYFGASIVDVKGRSQT